jgi:hypothetical protein
MEVAAEAKRPQAEASTVLMLEKQLAERAGRRSLASVGNSSVVALAVHAQAPALDQGRSVEAGVDGTSRPVAEITPWAHSDGTLPFLWPLGLKERAETWQAVSAISHLPAAV